MKIRADLNIPMFNGNVLDQSRVEKVIPTFNFLKSSGAKIVICSHLGRPNGKYNKSYTLKPLVKTLSKILETKVLFSNSCLGQEALDIKTSLKSSEILLLENVRFHEGETKNSFNFAKKLSEGCDIFVNDAFSCSHRSHASVEGITEYIPSYFGLQITEEINALKKITSEIKKPVSLIIGGSKISTKIKIINNLIKKFNNIIIVGGMANTMLKHTGINVGKSICEYECGPLIKEIIENSKKYNCEITIPKDVIVSESLNGGGKEKKINEVDENEMILDIGSKTISSIETIINNSETILWTWSGGVF
jgi:phosphoglycerate kinase